MAHEDVPGRGPSPARHARIRKWAGENGHPVPPSYVQVPIELELEYVKATGDVEGREPYVADFQDQIL